MCTCTCAFLQALEMAASSREKLDTQVATYGSRPSRLIPLPVLYVLIAGKKGGGIAEADIRKQDEIWLERKRKRVEDSSAGADDPDPAATSASAGGAPVRLELLAGPASAPSDARGAHSARAGSCTRGGDAAAAAAAAGA